MLGHGAKFDQKMEQAIAALLSHRNVETAAREVGISANTLLRWMKQPEFEEALREARRRVADRAIGRLQDAADAAATTVLKIMLDSNIPAGTRLRAAEVVLDRAVDAGEMEDIEDRVTKLERAAGLAGKSGQRTTGLTSLITKSLLGPGITPAQIAAPAPDTAAETDEDVVE
jgi:transposase-like protein